MQKQIAIGSCDGTGSAINVILGWVPDFVLCANIEDAGSLHALTFWFREFVIGASSVIDEGLQLTATPALLLLTANGIAPYTAAAELVYDGTTDNRWELVADDTDATEVYVDGHHRSYATAGTYKTIGDILCPDPKDGAKINVPDGFTIGTDANMNINGEQIVWLAIKQ